MHEIMEAALNEFGISCDSKKIAKPIDVVGEESIDVNNKEDEEKAKQDENEEKDEKEEKEEKEEEVENEEKEEKEETEEKSKYAYMIVVSKLDFFIICGEISTTNSLLKQARKCLLFFYLKIHEEHDFFLITTLNF